VPLSDPLPHNISHDTLHISNDCRFVAAPVVVAAPVAVAAPVVAVVAAADLVKIIIMK
jgi:hypothetical protein